MQPINLLRKLGGSASSLLLQSLAAAKAQTEMAGYFRAARNVEKIQENTLLRILHDNAATRYGKRHGFASIRSMRQYQERVPAVSYEHLEPDMIDARTIPGVLTHGKIVQWVQTSGTATSPKLVPHTEASLRDWSKGSARAVFAYIAGSRRARTAVRGKVLNSVAPANVYEINGVPVGYMSGVGSLRNRLLRRRMAIPEHLIGLADPEQKLHAMMKCAILKNITAASGITSFTHAFFEYVRANAYRLADDPAFSKTILAAKDTPTTVDLQKLWPGLRVIGSTGVAMELYRPLLKRMLPAVDFINLYTASEGAYGFGLTCEESSVALNIDLYHFELMPPGAPSRPLLLHEAEPGSVYELMITARNGLYRYLTGDIVRSVETSPPRIEVIGRGGNVVNVAGEKIIEQQVTNALINAVKEYDCHFADFIFLGWKSETRVNHLLAFEATGKIADAPAFAERYAQALAAENTLYTAVRHEFNAAMHVALLRPGTFARIIREGDLRKSASGHTKLRRLSTMELFCALVKPEEIVRHTMPYAIHVFNQSNKVPE